MCEHPPCVVCGKPVIRRPKEGLGQWRKREACSKECGLYLGQTRGAATTSLRVQPDPKPCVVCGKMMTRPHQESRARFAQRTTCSRACRCRLMSLRTGRDAPMSRYVKCVEPAPQPRPRPAKPKAIRPDLSMSRTEAERVMMRRQIDAYLAASPAERRLFAPAVVKAAGVRA